MALTLPRPCIPATFDGLTIPGGKLLSIEASLVLNYSAVSLDSYRFTQPTTALQNATFCNITVSYTHPGQNDHVYVEAWLPIENWNHRFLAVGGGGYATGRFFLSYANMIGALADGYATITTDAGLGGVLDPATWALVSEGNVNLYNLQNMASVSLHDEASKSMARSKLLTCIR
jgi:hypothetical protein